MVLLLAAVVWAQAVDLSHALTEANASGRRVVAVSGGDGCALCPDVMRALEGNTDGYLVVKLPAEAGPLVTILDCDGVVLAKRTAAQFSEAGRVLPAKLRSVLDRWRPGRPAAELFQAGLGRLDQGRLGLVEFRADWCVWCKRMEAFLARPAVQEILGPHLVVIPIDQDRNPGAAELSGRLGAPDNEGLPWFAIVDRAGKVQGTSQGPKGNVGFPADDEERAQFLEILRKAAPAITPAQVAKLDAELKVK